MALMGAAPIPDLPHCALYDQLLVSCWTTLQAQLLDSDAIGRVSTSPKESWGREGAISILCWVGRVPGNTQLQLLHWTPKH